MVIVYAVVVFYQLSTPSYSYWDCLFMVADCVMNNAVSVLVNAIGRFINPISIMLAVGIWLVVRRTAASKHR